MDELSWALVMDSLGSADRVMDSGVPLFHACSSRVFWLPPCCFLKQGSLKVTGTATD